MLYIAIGICEDVFILKFIKELVTADVSDNNPSWCYNKTNLRYDNDDNTKLTQIIILFF